MKVNKKYRFFDYQTLIIINKIIKLMLDKNKLGYFVITRNKRTHSIIIKWQVQSHYLTFFNSHSTHGKVHGTPVVIKWH